MRSVCSVGKLSEARELGDRPKRFFSLYRLFCGWADRKSSLVTGFLLLILFQNPMDEYCLGLEYPDLRIIAMSPVAGLFMRYDNV
jgi:hypothetical protein